MNQVLVIDDRKIRKSAFAEAEQLIKKIDLLGLDLESFRAQDQRLFSSWYELTFSDTQKVIAERRDELYELMKRHNWMIAVAQQLGISLPEAFAILEEEERRYKTGTSEERLEIDGFREDREDYILNEIDEKAAAEESYFDEPEFDEREPAEDENEPPRRTESEERQFRTIENLSDDNVRLVCATLEGAQEVLGAILRLMKSDADFHVFLRVWDLTPPRIQKSFAKGVAQQTGVNLMDFIQDMRIRAAKYAFMNQKRPHGEEDFDINEPDFDGPDFDDFVGEEKDGPSSQELTGVQMEAIKLLYRKLVRYLHPDLHDDKDGRATWRKQIWNRVQAANLALDHQGLQKLYRLVLIRDERLDQLTLSEIFESKNWFKQELEELSLEVKDLKKSPAWGFSRRKSYASLQRKLEKPLAKELQLIEKKLEEFKADRQLLEMMARSKSYRLRQKPKRKKSRARRRSSY